MFRYILFLLLVIATLNAGQVTIFGAANLKFFFSDILDEYNKKYPNDKIVICFDATGNLVKKVKAGEKYDIFLAANMKYPQELYKQKLASTKPKIYTTGSLILLVSKHDKLNDDKLNILTDRSIKEITIANKKTAPYGMAAIEALKNSKLYDKVKDKLFYSTDASNIIGDVLWYGNAGILPKSAVNFLPRGYNKYGENYILVDQKLYTPIRQGFVFSKQGSANLAAKRFIDFLLGEGQNIFKEHGYN
ncbi:MAG: molybdate ABC transporter substrate-binding protein [Campylobacterota bacterium]|nr:molybdate ABC transporter substrate-binding protein [Campylobacterota bacterium]